jgi:Transposase
MAYLRRRQRLGDTSPPAPAGLTPRRAVGLMLVRPADRRVEERQTVEQLKTLDPVIRQAVTLLEDFLRMIRDGPHEHPREQLDPWIAQAVGSSLPEFAAFVIKLGQDLDAVLAGLQLPWSQGQTEGVRRVTQLWISPCRGMELEGRFQGHPPHFAPKGNEDQSMAGTRCRLRGVASQGAARPASYGKSLIAQNLVLTV